MKGLLLKDFYVARKHCKVFVIIMAVFMAISFAGDGDLFFLIYPCFLTGMIPVTLLSYDEHSRWSEYSGTLPCSREQIVSEKYVVGIIIQAAVMIIAGAAQAVKMSFNGGFELSGFMMLIGTIALVQSLSLSVCLPFIFKLGIEKGRIAYYFVIGFMCAVSAFASSLSVTGLKIDLNRANPNFIALAMLLLAAASYAVSWRLSVNFYEARRRKK